MVLYDCTAGHGRFDDRESAVRAVMKELTSALWNNGLYTDSWDTTGIALTAARLFNPFASEGPLCDYLATYRTWLKALRLPLDSEVDRTKGDYATYKGDLAPEMDGKVADAEIGYTRGKLEAYQVRHVCPADT